MKQTPSLTPSRIEALHNGVLPDSEVPGLAIIAAGPGRKRWRFKRMIAGTRTVVELKLGLFPDFSIADAREWATPLSRATAHGEDPRVAMRAEKAKSETTVAKAHALYMAAMHRGDRKKLKPRTLSDKAVIYSRDIGPRLGTKSLYELTEDECWDAVYDKAEASKRRANKMAANSAASCVGAPGARGVDGRNRARGAPGTHAQLELVRHRTQGEQALPHR